MKKCIKCGEEKDDILFVKGKNSCKLCISEYKKNHRINNSEKIKEYMNSYYNLNKDVILDRLKENYTLNKESKLEYQKKYAEENKEKIKEYKSKHSKENREKITKYKSIYQRERRKTDSIFKLKFTISGLIRKSFKSKGFSKNKKTIEILGCEIEFFKNYLENLFIDGMNWDNHGKVWDIDHKIPLSSAITEEDVIKLNHYTNLQPLNSYINRVVKRDKIDYI